MSADNDGNVFYIDDSTVLNLTATAINEMTTNPLLVGAKQAVILLSYRVSYPHLILNALCHMKMHHNIPVLIMYKIQMTVIG